MDPAVPMKQNLASLADGLKPCEEVEKSGNLLLDRILTVVKEKSRSPIHRVVKAGSLGKKTAIALKVDYDCVFLLDGQRPDFRDQFLDDLEDILHLHAPGGGVANLSRTVNSIGFEKDGFSFDFLPAAFVSSEPEVQVKSLAKTCLATADDKQYKAVRTGLVEGTVLFMREQSSLTHQLARLLKYWSHTVLVPGFFNGRSYTLELFAALTTDDMRERGSEECLLYAFRLALVNLREFRTVRKVWDRFYDAEAARTANSSPDGPLLLDVSDPRNNMLGPDRQGFFEQLAKYAGVTLGRLGALECGVPAVLVNLFDPQPKIWNVLRNVPKRDSFLVGGAKTLPHGQQLVQPRVEVRIAAQFIGKEMEMYAHVLCALMEREFFAYADKFKNSSTRNTDCQKLAQRSVDEVFFGIKQERNWTSFSDKFEDKNVELMLPVCRSVSNGMYVQVGFDVENNTETTNFGDYKMSIAYWDDMGSAVSRPTKLGGA